jgi:hypothetical protein
MRRAILVSFLAVAAACSSGDDGGGSEDGGGGSDSTRSDGSDGGKGDSTTGDGGESDGASRDGTSNDGTGNDGGIGDGGGSDAPANVDASSDGASSDDTTGDDASSDDAGSDATMSDDGGSGSDGITSDDASSDGAGSDTTMSDDGGSSDGTTGDDTGSDGADSSEDGGGTVSVVYVNTARYLYRFDPASQQFSVVGHLGCSGTTNDIAIDSSLNAYAVSTTGFWSLDLSTAKCTQIASGDYYPTSLSFVPAGTVDPNVEALVGYDLSRNYIRIDPTTGQMQTIGKLSGYRLVGDIVSVRGGGTFVTVEGGAANCQDCLIQVDPTTGDIVQSYGSLGQSMVLGLAFWAGTVYGFSSYDVALSTGWQNNQLITTSIPVPTLPSPQFLGAGSPPWATVTADGGLPLQ